MKKYKLPKNFLIYEVTQKLFEGETIYLDEKVSEDESVHSPDDDIIDDRDLPSEEN